MFNSDCNHFLLGFTFFFQCWVQFSLIVFKTLSNIFDEAFEQESLIHLAIEYFCKKLHPTCLGGPSAPLFGIDWGSSSVLFWQKVAQKISKNYQEQIHDRGQNLWNCKLETCNFQILNFQVSCEFFRISGATFQFNNCKQQPCKLPEKKIFF